MLSKSDAEDTIKQALGQKPSVSEFVIEEASKDGEGEFSGICRVKHSRAFNGLSNNDIDQFDEIQFNELYTANQEDGIKYGFFLFERQWSGI